jgi:hypothetical protein
MTEESNKLEIKILCACGCGELINRYYMSERHLRERKYKHSHYWRGKPKPFVTHGENNPNWKGGRYLHSRGYVYVKKPEHPRAEKWGYVLEHILVMEQHIGRYLNPGEEVHHVNHIKTDNRIENLRLTTKTEHPTFHTKDMSERKCSDCGRGVDEVGRHKWCHNPEDRNKMCCLTCYKRRVKVALRQNCQN